MVKKSGILMQQNLKRSLHPSLSMFIVYLFDKIISVETICRRECMKLWEALVRNIPPRNAENIPDKPNVWILDYHPKFRKDMSFFKRLQKLEFNDAHALAGGEGRDHQI